jgi:hypothetical protein
MEFETMYYYYAIAARASLLALAMIQPGDLRLKPDPLDQPSYYLLAIDLLSSIEMCLCLPSYVGCINSLLIRSAYTRITIGGLLNPCWLLVLQRKNGPTALILILSIH